jgi:hypothetical protein
LSAVQVLPRWLATSSTDPAISTTSCATTTAMAMLLRRPSSAILSYLALVLVPYSDLLDVLNVMCMVKCVCAYVVLPSETKFTQKLPNNLT